MAKFFLRRGIALAPRAIPIEGRQWFAFVGPAKLVAQETPIMPVPPELLN